MMRSGDASNIVWALFVYENKHYIKARDKNGVIQTFSFQGQTLNTLLEYMKRHLDNPGMYLFRYIKKPWENLGSERLAKRLMNIMQEENIDTQVYKAHSLRGATATHLLQQGTPQTLVQARGKWASSKTMDDYYSRLHQTENWEKLLGGHGEERQASACAVLPLPVSQPKPTEEGERGETQEESTAQVDALAAQGVLRPFYCTLNCPSCDQKMGNEAVYRCKICKSIFHVRCMGASDCTAKPGIKYPVVCFLCGRKEEEKEELQANKKQKLDHLIVDVMGV